MYAVNFMGPSTVNLFHRVMSGGELSEACAEGMFCVLHKRNRKIKQIIIRAYLQLHVWINCFKDDSNMLVTFAAEWDSQY